MTNIDTKDNIQIDGTEIEKATNYKYQRQTIATENRTKQDDFDKNKSRMGWGFSLVCCCCRRCCFVCVFVCLFFRKYRELFLDRHLPMSIQKRSLSSVSYQQ